MFLLEKQFALKNFLNNIHPKIKEILEKEKKEFEEEPLGFFEYIEDSTKKD